MRVAIYCRVSTSYKGQDIDMQRTDLLAYYTARGWTVVKEYIDDGISGAKLDRKSFKELMIDAKQRKFDAVLVWKLNRFSRSMIHLVSSVNELEAMGVQFVSLKDSIDFTTPAGRLQFHLLAALAEFERENIRENVRSGIENARRKGKRIGRKGLAPVERRQIIEAHADNPGLFIRQLAKLTKQKPSSVHKTLSLYRKGKLDKEGFVHD